MGEAEVKIEVGEEPEVEKEVGEEPEVEIEMGEEPEIKIEVRGEAHLKIMGEGTISFTPTPSSKQKFFPIQRVPSHVREVAAGVYDPSVISIGPFHHRRLQGNRGMKEIFLKSLIRRGDRSQQDVASVIERYSEYIRHSEEKARGYYSEEWMDLSSKQFLEMLVLDGCFILELFISFTLGEEDNWVLYANNWMPGLLRNDLMLVENQLPYFILEELFEQTTIPEDFDEAVEKYRKEGLLKRMALYFLTKGEESEYKEIDDAEPYHLLHLLQLFLRPSPEYVSKRRWFGRLDPLNGGIIFLIVWVLLFPLMLANFLYLWFSKFINKRRNTLRRIRTAKRMREAWVNFKKEGETTIRFTEVKFEGRTLSMPQLQINQLTRTLLPNLIALEQMLSYKKETKPKTTNKLDEWFSSYAWLLFNLVDTDEDVAILQREEIILTNIGSDKEVADYITNLCKGHLLGFGTLGQSPAQKREDTRQEEVVPYHREIFDQLNEHIDDPSNTWVAILSGTYFSSPWVLIGLWSAIILFVLQVLQVFQASK